MDGDFSKRENVAYRGAKATWNISAVYGDNAIGESTASKWFTRFKEDHFDISDTPCSGRSSGFDEDRLNSLIQLSTSMYSRTGNTLNCDHSTIERHLHSMGKVLKSRVWVPHALSQNHKISGGPYYVHLCLLFIDWLVNKSDHFYPLSLLVTRNGVFMLTYGKERNGWARTREEYVGNVPISPFGTPYSSLHGSTHYFRMKKLQYVNSSTTIELQIKNDNR